MYVSLETLSQIARDILHGSSYAHERILRSRVADAV